jgi:DNA helicase II / ATP-dependent DNA helicase PcrA
MDDLLRLLNNEQYLSVSKTDGPSLILAGAGSGKTRVITYKIIHLIDKGIPADHILALTFTNKAAAEMKERVGQLRGKSKKKPLLTTFHSLGLKILKEQITNLGYKSKFSIYDERDCQKLLKDIVNELRLPEDEYDLYALTFKISLIKMNLQSKIEDVNLKNIFLKYQEYLKLYNACDFDDLIKLPIDLFLKYPDILEKYQKKWKYILVDEYQDTSLMQYQFMKMLACEHKNISVVGDDDQSIYSWRGANSNNLTMFERDFYPVYEVRLEQNYRSTGNILKAANSIIKFNSNRKSKQLWTKGEDGDKICFYEASDEESEADYVLTMINRLKGEGYNYSDFGILFRMNSQSRPIEEKLRENNIPYKLIGSMKFFDRPEIRDILSYMRFIANTDDEVALHRIINNPKRGIGNTTIHEIMEFSKINNCSLYLTLKNFVESKILGTKMTPYIEDFYNLIEKYRDLIFKPKHIARTVTSLVDEIDYKGKLICEMKDLKKVGYRMNNINQLVQSISRYENDPDNFEPNIFDYLQRISLANQDNNDKKDKEDQVNMMSIHSAKGLEFKVIFVVGVEEGLLPHFKTVEESGTEEEERRLFYVAVTRAREKLFLTYPKTRMKFNETMHKEISSFVKEIPDDVLDFIDLEEELGKKDSFAELLKKWNG